MWPLSSVGAEPNTPAGAVSDGGYRVFVSRNNPQNAVGTQVRDPDACSGFPKG